MKRYKLKSWVKYLLIIIATIAIVKICDKLIEMDQEFVNNCVAQGYSKYHCESHK